MENTYFYCEGVEEKNWRISKDTGKYHGILTNIKVFEGIIGSKKGLILVYFLHY